MASGCHSGRSYWMLGESSLQVRWCSAVTGHESSRGSLSLRLSAQSWPKLQLSSATATVPLQEGIWIQWCAEVPFNHPFISWRHCWVECHNNIVWASRAPADPSLWHQPYVSLVPWAAGSIVSLCPAVAPRTQPCCQSIILSSLLMSVIFLGREGTDSLA